MSQKIIKRAGFRSFKRFVFMTRLGNYITGKWIEGDGEGQILYNAFSGDAIAVASTSGLDFKSIIDYGRERGNPALRKMTFRERGNMLKALALHLRDASGKILCNQLSNRRYPVR